MRQPLAAAVTIIAGFACCAHAGQRGTSGTYIGKHGDTGSWSRTMTSSNGSYEREGSWTGTNGSGSYGGVGTRGDGSGSFSGTFERNGGGIGTIQTITQSTGDGHTTVGERTKPDGETHYIDRTRTLTDSGYVINGSNTSANGGQRERSTVDVNGTATTTITHPDGSTSTSVRTGRAPGS